MSNSSLSKSNRKAIVLVIDGCGVGAAPDVQSFGDRSDCNSMANTAKAVGGLKLPNLERMGLGHITKIEGVKAADQTNGLYGKLQEKSAGKDTQTGHWEMMGIVSSTPFRTYPDGFPQEILDRFIKETGCKGVLVNKPYSGTEVIAKYGEEHQKTGYPIVYTSGDSVFQLACHVDTIPLETQYKWCAIAREIMRGPHLIGRIIARPFKGEPGDYKRLSFERRDYGVKPPQPTFMDNFVDAGAGVLGIGKIEDIFDKQGVTHAQHTGTNKEGLELTLKAIKNEFDLKNHAVVKNAPDAVQFVFTNLVDTDMLFGHRRDVQGYAGALTEIDHWLGEIMEAMSEQDVLLISSDHGNDPTAPGTDHTREFVPILAFSKALQKSSAPQHNLGVRDGFYDIAASLSSWFGIDWKGKGKSFLPQLSGVKQ
ncbi:MAG TPA: phosphopentomutase [Candidatus Obscuribacterales bacterium]